MRWRIMIETMSEEDAVMQHAHPGESANSFASTRNPRHRHQAARRNHDRFGRPRLTTPH